MALPERGQNVFEEIRLNGSDAKWKPRPATYATSARPGTADKIIVFALRLFAGEELFHPNDPQADWSDAILGDLARLEVKRRHQGGRSRFKKRESA